MKSYANVSDVSPKNPNLTDRECSYIDIFQDDKNQRPTTKPINHNSQPLSICHRSNLVGTMRNEANSPKLGQIPFSTFSKVLKIQSCQVTILILFDFLRMKVLRKKFQNPNIEQSIQCDETKNRKSLKKSIHRSMLFFI